VLGSGDRGVRRWDRDDFIRGPCDRLARPALSHEGEENEVGKFALLFRGGEGFRVSLPGKPIAN